MLKKRTLHPYWWGLIVNLLIAGAVLAMYLSAVPH